MRNLLSSLASAAIMLGTIAPPAFAAAPISNTAHVDMLPVVNPGYQIRVVGDSVTVLISDRGEATRYSGRIETDGEVVDLRAIKPEIRTHDIVRETPNAVRFSMSTGPHVD